MTFDPESLDKAHEHIRALWGNDDFKAYMNLIVAMREEQVTKSYSEDIIKDERALAAVCCSIQCLDAMIAPVKHAFRDNF